MKKILAFFTNNKEPVGLKAINLSYCTKPKKEEEACKSAKATYKRALKIKKIKPKKIQSWDLPAAFKNTDFYKSLNNLKDKD